jgi:hypothetical protein
MAAPYTAAPATTPSPMPMLLTCTGAEDEVPVDPGLPFEFVGLLVWPALAELIGVPPGMLDPASTGIEGSIMLMSVCTLGFGFWYNAEFGFRSSRESWSTMAAGIYAIASVVMYPSEDRVLYGCRYCMTISEAGMSRP